MREAACFQHTRALLALTCLIGVVEKFSPPPELEDLHKALSRDLALCAKGTRKHRVSEGAKRAHASACDTLFPWLTDYKDLHPDICFFRFAAVCYCALTLVEDVCNVCPAICTAAYRPHWQALRQNLSDLCDGLMELEEGIDVAGSDLYECLVDAMMGHKDDIPIQNLAYAFLHHKAAMTSAG